MGIWYSLWEKRRKKTKEKEHWQRGEKALRETRESLGGVYALVCRESGTRWLGATEDMERERRRFLAYQAQGKAPQRELEQEWEAHGKAFVFEVVESVPKRQGQEPAEYRQEMEALKEWMDMQPFGCG